MTKLGVNVIDTWKIKVQLEPFTLACAQSCTTALLSGCRRCCQESNSHTPSDPDGGGDGSDPTSKISICLTLPGVRREYAKDTMRRGHNYVIPLVHQIWDRLTLEPIRLRSRSMMSCSSTSLQCGAWCGGRFVIGCTRVSCNPHLPKRLLFCMC